MKKLLVALLWFPLVSSASPAVAYVNTPNAVVLLLPDQYPCEKGWQAAVLALKSMPAGEAGCWKREGNKVTIKSPSGEVEFSDDMFTWVNP